jgi:hypothetical protein
MTRTELIAEARQAQIYLAGVSSAGILCGHMADMLEADAQTDDMLMSAARESAARAIAERDKLQAAAKLALDALLEVTRPRKLAQDDAIAALTGALQENKVRPTLVSQSKI